VTDALDRGRIMRRFGVITAMLAAAIMAAGGDVAAAESRVALVIGNAAYRNAPRLANPRNDAEAVAGALKRLGFAVVVGFDLDVGALRDTLADFGRKAEGAEVAVAYYAGHAIQVGGTNYILPVDARLNREQDLNWQTIPVDYVLDELAGARKLKIVLLDACRDNPLAQRMARGMGTRSASVGRGLAVVQRKVTDTLIAYATGAGDVAEDGAGGHSPFTEAFLAHIDEPGLEIRRFFGKVSDTVRAKTGGRQEPYVYTSLGGDAFFWRPGAASAAPAGPSAPSAETVFWQSIQSSANPAAFEAYLSQYPNGAFAALARVKIAELSGAQVAAVRPAPVPAGPSPVQPAVGVYPGAHKPGDTFRDCADCPEMVVVPAGAFDMGSPTNEEGRFDSEGPVHRVTIPRPFAVGKYEVTQAEWVAVMGSNPSRFTGERNPVEQVSWNDAKEFVKRLSAKTGKSYRLLSEAEWEYAARAGSRAKYPWGDGIDSSKAKYDSRDGTVPVGRYGANAFGLFDTVGNVWEWVEDCWNESYSGAPTDGSAWTSGNCAVRVLRGGSWVSRPGNVRSANRSRNDTDIRYDFNGFRVARTL